MSIRGCNSFYFYIKPQLNGGAAGAKPVVIHSISTSNHNQLLLFLLVFQVVIHSISTSNHNCAVFFACCRQRCNSFYFYIKPQPYVDLSDWQKSCNSFYFYIKPQPIRRQIEGRNCCNSFYFYIKPQLRIPYDRLSKVVIHSISTSNHNLLMFHLCNL